MLRPQDAEVREDVAHPAAADGERVDGDRSAAAISVPTVTRPEFTACAVAVRCCSPRLEMTTVIGASKAWTAAMLRLRRSASRDGSMIALGRISSEEPPE